MNEWLFTLDTIIDNYKSTVIGRSFVNVLIKRLEELAHSDKAVENTIRRWTLETLSDCVEKYQIKEDAESAYSKAAYRDNPEPPEILKELRKELNEAEKEFEDSLIVLKSETLELLRIK